MAVLKSLDLAEVTSGLITICLQHMYGCIPASFAGWLAWVFLSSAYRLSSGVRRIARL